MGITTRRYHLSSSRIGRRRQRSATANAQVWPHSRLTMSMVILAVIVLPQVVLIAHASLASSTSLLSPPSPPPPPRPFSIPYSLPSSSSEELGQGVGQLISLDPGTRQHSSHTPFQIERSAEGHVDAAHDLEEPIISSARWRQKLVKRADSVDIDGDGQQDGTVMTRKAQFPIAQVSVALLIFFMIICAVIAYLYKSYKNKREERYGSGRNRRNSRQQYRTNVPRRRQSGTNLPSSPTLRAPQQAHFYNGNTTNSSDVGAFNPATSTTYLPPYSAERLPSYSDTNLSGSGRNHGIGQGMRVVLNIATAPTRVVDVEEGTGVGGGDGGSGLGEEVEMGDLGRRG